eukprot:g19310.t1
MAPVAFFLGALHLLLSRPTPEHAGPAQDQLDHQLGDLPNASRYYQKMQEFQDLSQMEFQSELTQLTVVSRGFNSWCNAHSDLVLGFLSFLACSVLIALCIPCGLAPVQLIAWAISEEPPVSVPAPVNHGDPTLTTPGMRNTPPVGDLLESGALHIQIVPCITMLLHILW